MSELPERILAGLAIAVIAVVTFVVWPPSLGGGSDDATTEDESA